MLLILALSVSVGLRAQSRKFMQNPANHFITISLGGGEANSFSSFSIPESKDKAGADALFGIGYELRKKSFVFGFGAQVDFELTRQALGNFVETENRRDFENDPHVYSYRYSNYQDRQRNLQLGVPVYFGMYFNRYVYGLIGAKFCMPLLGNHSTTTTLTTDGTYARYPDVVTDMPRYGFYTPDTYSYTGVSVQHMRVGPTLEIGSRLPVYSPSRRFGMRVGLYAEYMIPLDFTDTYFLVDYSAVDKGATTLSKENLQQNIVFNSALNSPYQNAKANYFSVGLKFTFLFNVTSVPTICNCDADLPMRRSRSTQSSHARVNR